MCEITGFAELDWEDDIAEGKVSLVNFNGRKHEVTVLRQDDTFASSIYKSGAHGCTLQHRSVKPMDFDGSGEVSFRVKWGDKDGTQVQVGARGEAHDEEGNFTEFRYIHDIDGEKDLRINAGRRERERE
jgi:hypothetical protein